jgi:hypothetical protein
LVWIVVSSVLGLLLLFCLFIGVIVLAVFSSFKSSTPYQHAVSVATQDQRVQAALGSAVQPGWFAGGSIHIAGGSGEANLDIPVQGALHKGTLYVEAKKSEGEWTYQKLALRVDDSGERIDLLRPPGRVLPEKEE